MKRDIIDYGELVDESMHIIVYKVLKIVEKNGLPGDHHFFISFLTQHPGVRLGKSLRDKYPREMTIVLQYQYQDLKIENIGFGVTLSFNGVRESIYIPYSAITTFADPSVQFGLQFRELDHHHHEVNLDFLEDELEKLENKSHNRHTLQENVRGGGKVKKMITDNIVSLDQFRKK